MLLTRQDMPTIPVEARQIFREGKWTDRTSGLCLGFTNAAIAIMPRDQAFDFLLFCQRNPKPCPLLEVLDPGDPIVSDLAPGADIRTDVARYRVMVKGEVVDEPSDLTQHWRDDLVTFLMGCSGTFEAALEGAGIVPRWRQGDETGSGIYLTNIPTTPAGIFHGPLVVTMRPIPNHQVSRAVQVSSRFPGHHGAPIHIGDPAALGIDDMSKSEWAVGPKLLPGEVPVFWACGVTLQTLVRESKPDLMITHYPSRMFITDIPAEEQAVM
ncbi:MAG: putative hydro-lyase [Dehalococcoidia bacterium]|jgi:uncharacterized protein YcsI (UPF0317 family)|nr:putative hydro-lyase [Dehalococcoidia bacterium]